MAADAGPHTTLFGLEVTDDAGYTQYRSAMAPILARHGGAFGCDFVVARVLKGPNTRINRVFTVMFPSSANRDRFFADEEYRSVRARWFEPAVGAVEVLVETSPDVARPTWMEVSDAGVVASMPPSPKTRAETFCARHGLRVPRLWRPWRARVLPSYPLPSRAAAAWAPWVPVGTINLENWPNARSRTLASPLPPACAGQRSE